MSKGDNEMNNVSLLKKCRIKFVLHRLNKLGLFPKENFVFSPELLFLDLFDETQDEPINVSVLKKIIFQIENHLNINDELSCEININKDIWKPYSKCNKPISIVNKRLCVNLCYLYNHDDPHNSMLNIGLSEFIAILCKEIARYYLEKNNIFFKAEFDVEMAMCLLGICKEAHLLPYVGTMYFQNEKIKIQNYFTSTNKELCYALTLCQKNTR